MEDFSVKVTPFESSIRDLVYKSWEDSSRKAEARPYLGISIIGEPCERKLWFGFRWFLKIVNEGRLELLFERGRREEASIVSNLAWIGCELKYILDDQMDIDFGSHVKGHPDGLILAGVPEAPNTLHALEMKTHNKDSFDKLEKNGVRVAKPMHYDQMQCEMLGFSMKLGRKVDRCLYYAVCKDDDRIYTERIFLDEEYAKSLIARGQRIATSDSMPDMMSVASPTHFECKWCSYYDACFKKKLPDINCRTCSHFSALANGTCTCAMFGNAEIPLENQRIGCENHVFHPDMVQHWKLMTDKCTPYSACYMIDGELYMNGYGGWTSKDLKKRFEGYEDSAETVSDDSHSIPF